MKIDFPGPSLEAVVTFILIAAVTAIVCVGLVFWFLW
jgi:hypothetical protein